MTCTRALTDDAAGRYLAGAMPRAEGDAFEAHLLECDDCRAVVDAQLDLRRVLRGDRSASSAARRRWTRLGLAASVIVALGLGAAVLLRVLPAGSVAGGGAATPPIPVGEPAEAPAAEALIALRKPDVVLSAERVLRMRGADGDRFAAAFAEAIAPYRADDYLEAARRLEALALEHPEAFEAHFYLGVSLLLAERAGEAIGPLERARDLATPPRLDDAGWFLAVARVRAGRRDLGVAAIEALCAGTGSRRADACDALQKLLK